MNHAASFGIGCILGTALTLTAQSCAPAQEPSPPPTQYKEETAFTVKSVKIRLKELTENPYDDDQIEIIRWNNERTIRELWKPQRDREGTCRLTRTSEEGYFR